MPPAITDPFRITYRSGNEHNPGDPTGLVVLAIAGDGAVTVSQRARGGAVQNQWAGTTDRGVIERVIEHLAVAKFPLVPDHRIVAGSTLRTIEITTGETTQTCNPTSWDAVDAMPGYREAYRLLDSITTEVTAGSLKMLVDPEPGLARPSAC